MNYLLLIPENIYNMEKRVMYNARCTSSSCKSIKSFLMNNIIIKKFFVLSLVFRLLILSSVPVFASQAIEFKLPEKPALLLDTESPTVYKPTRLIVGKETKFIIKGFPKSNVSLLMSESNEGAPLFYGQKLNLGADITAKEAVIPENGVLELGIKLPDDKKLEDQVRYFEVAVWKNKDYSDLKLAKIVGPNGQRTGLNKIKIYLPNEDSTRPTFAPVMPGMPVNMIQTMQTIEKIKNGDTEQLNRDYEIEKLKEKPLIQK